MQFLPVSRRYDWWRAKFPEHKNFVRGTTDPAAPDCTSAEAMACESTCSSYLDLFLHRIQKRNRINRTSKFTKSRRAYCMDPALHDAACDSAPDCSMCAQFAPCSATGGGKQSSGIANFARGTTGCPMDMQDCSDGSHRNDLL